MHLSSNAKSDYNVADVDRSSPLRKTNWSKSYKSKGNAQQQPTNTIHLGRFHYLHDITKLHETLATTHMDMPVADLKRAEVNRNRATAKRDKTLMSQVKSEAMNKMTEVENEKIRLQKISIPHGRLETTEMNENPRKEHRMICRIITKKLEKDSQ